MSRAAKGWAYAAKVSREQKRQRLVARATRLLLLLLGLASLVAIAVLRRQPMPTAELGPYPPEGDDGVQPPDPGLADWHWRDALADPAFRSALDEGLADLHAGRVTPWAPKP